MLRWIQHSISLRMDVIAELISSHMDGVQEGGQENG